MEGLSDTLDAWLCLETPEEVRALYGVQEIFNTDQASQLTSEQFITDLESRGIRISMDGRARWRQHICRAFVEERQI